MLCATLRNDEKRQNQNSDSEGRGFESRRAYHIKKPVLSMLCGILTLAVFMLFTVRFLLC